MPSLSFPLRFYQDSPSSPHLTADFLYCPQGLRRPSLLRVSRLCHSLSVQKYKERRMRLQEVPWPWPPLKRWVSREGRHLSLRSVRQKSWHFHKALLLFRGG